MVSDVLLNVRHHHSSEMESSLAASVPSKSLYSRLPLKPWQTRLLRLHHDGEDSPLSGDLIVADITHLDGAVLHERQELVEYLALSYTWGDGPSSKSVVLNGLQVQIKQTLFEFLLSYRKSFNDEFQRCYIWIDAVCINQIDDVEKSVQVSSMMVFYQRARQVVVWLGTGSANSHAAMDFLQGGESLSPDAKGRVAHSRPRSNLERGLLELYSTPWATRIWVKQEIWSAKDITVFCGRRSVSWEKFSKMFESLKNAEDVSNNYLGDEPTSRSHSLEEAHMPTSKYDALMRLRRPPRQVRLRDKTSSLHSRGSSEEGKDILHLLEDARYCESTDIRDRIYALLGMCNDRGIRVDYTVDAPGVFISLAKHLIEREGRVAAVLALNSLFGSQHDIRLPTWVPDWRNLEVNAMDEAWQAAFDLGKGYHRKYLDLEHVLHLPFKRRGPNMVASRLPQILFKLEAPLTLRLRGFILAILPKDTETRQLESLRVPWNPLSDIPSLSPPTGDDKFQKWQRTLKSRALEILNASPPSSRQTPHDAAFIKQRNNILKALGFTVEKYIPAHIRAGQATLADLEDLGASAFQLSPARKGTLELEGGDILAVVHGCCSPLVLRPARQDNGDQFTFVGIVRCVEVHRLSERPRGSLSLYEEFRIVLHARAALHLTETFEVV